MLAGCALCAALAFWGNAVFLFGALLLSAIFGSGAWEGDAHPSLAFLLRGWVMPTALDLSLMMATGVVAALGLTLLTQAYRIAEASVVTPFEYTAMVWSVIYGWIIWQDWPRVLDWIGIANEGHDAFRIALAQAAGTTPERVAVHALHQHDAPGCDFTAEKLIKELGVTAE